jgi:hypothetical protein
MNENRFPGNKQINGKNWGRNVYIGLLRSVVSSGFFCFDIQTFQCLIVKK